MKRIYSALALFAAAGLCLSAQSYKSVAVNLADGSKTEVNLSDDLSAAFDDENLVITGGDQNISVLRSSIKSFTFSEKAYSGIEQVDGGLFDENIYYLCKREDGQGITRYYIVRDDRTEDDTPILAGDVIQVYGQLFGSCKLPGYLVKTQPVVPALTIVYFDLLAE